MKIRLLVTATAIAGCGQPPIPVISVETQALTVGPELELEPRAIASASMSQGRGQVAFDGQQYLSLWSDQRFGYGEPFLPPDWVPKQLWAARVTTTGMVSPAAGRHVPVVTTPTRSIERAYGVGCDGAGTCVSVSGVVRDGTSYRVDLIGHRYVNGVPVGGSIAIAGASHSVPFDMWSAVAWDGTAFEVVYETGSGASRTINRLRVLPDGTTASALTLGQGDSPSVACGPSSCLTVWQSNNDLVGRRFDGTGALGVAFTIGPAVLDGLVDIAWTGTQYWVAWSETETTLAGARVSQTGTVLDASGITLATGATLRGLGVTFDGSNVTATWSDASALRLARLAPSGTVLDPGGEIIATGLGPDADIACSAGECLVQTSGGTPTDVVGIRVAVNGAEPVVLDPQPRLISGAASAQSQIAIDGRGGAYVAAWIAGNDGFRVRAARFAAGIASTTPFDVELTTTYEPWTLDVAIGATSTLIAWTSRTDDPVRARIFDADGQPLGASFVVGDIPLAYERIAVSASDDRFVVAWVAYATGDPNGRVLARIYDASGGLIGSTVDLGAGGTGSTVSTAFDGTNFVIMWHVATALKIVRVSPLAVAIDAPPSSFVMDTEDVTDQAIACLGTTCLALAEASTLESIFVMRAIRILTLGPQITLLDGPTPPTPMPAYRPQVASAGNRFVLGWSEGFRPTAEMRVTTMGTTGPAETSVSVSPITDPNRPGGIAHDGLGHAVAIYERFDESATAGAWRIKARELGDLTPTSDAGVPDAATPDAAIPDAAAPDAAIADGGAPDAAAPDAAPPDAPSLDAGRDDSDGDGGCGCRSSGSGGWLVGLALVLFVRPRRKQRLARRRRN